VRWLGLGTLATLLAVALPAMPAAAQTPASGGADVDADTAALYRFTPADRRFLAPFSLTRLPPLPAAPSNRWADDPAAAALGQALFFDAGLSTSGRFSCSSCHQPGRHFTDGLARGQATGVVRRSTPSVLGAAHSPWLNWDGRADSLWAQALEPIEHPDELATTRAAYVARLLARHGQAYAAVFGAPVGLPPAEALGQAASPLGDTAARQRRLAWSTAERQAVDRVFSHAGKALMAYQRRLVLPLARFDRFVDALANDAEGQDSALLRTLLAPDEVAGLRLFMGRARCASCHNGALFTNFEFHNVAAPEADRTRVDLGRHEGVQALQASEFTCLSPHSDAAPGQCDEMRFLKTSGPELVGAFKTPSLRNVATTAPYMHGGQFATLAEVLAHYNAPQPPFFDPAQHPSRPHFDILPLQLAPAEIDQLVAFLGSLTSPVPADDPWWAPPARR
jgi:cytochrome c peroxidase